MQHYRMTVEADRDLTEEQQMSVIDVLGDTYDAATITPRRMEIDGAVPGTVLFTYDFLTFASKVIEEKGCRVTACLNVDTEASATA